MLSVEKFQKARAQEYFLVFLRKTCTLLVIQEKVPSKPLIQCGSIFWTQNTKPQIVTRVTGDADVVFGRNKSDRNNFAI